MHYEIHEFNKTLFFNETGFHASEHPHLYFAWIQIKMLDKVYQELKQSKS